jgi:hypothetical protein
MQSCLRQIRLLMRINSSSRLSYFSSGDSPVSCGNVLSSSMRDERNRALGFPVQVPVSYAPIPFSGFAFLKTVAGSHCKLCDKQLTTKEELCSHMKTREHYDLFANQCYHSSSLPLVMRRE